MATEAQRFAAEFGYQLAFLKSDKELYSIFQKAMKGDWDSTKFVAAVKNSKWYKTHGEAYRTNAALKHTDPATFKQKVSAERARIADVATQMGAPVPGGVMAKITEDSILFGWNDSQLRDAISKYVKTSPTSVGTAGEIRQALQQTAFRNGIAINESYTSTAAARVARGETTVENEQQRLRQQYAKALAPGFAKEIDSGMDLYDLASPYMQTMAQTLELNPSDIDLFDPTIKRALASSSDKDGQVGSTPLWQFQQNLRQDPRYMRTNQAQNDVMATGKKVLADMGLV